MQREVFLFLSLCSSLIFAKDTELQYYRPFAARELPIAIELASSGECKEQSYLIRREDAWKCTVADTTYDPCFAKDSSENPLAVCLSSPWESKGVQVTLAKPLDSSQNEVLDMSTAFPWALELLSGEKCLAVQSFGQIDGLPVRYVCDNKTRLFGHVQRCSAEWQMLQETTGGMHPAKIKKAWF
ncbi:hypothetical protein [Legionella septentrionalis]|uniref:hypothetical protein n=1 Tax=Legionella septentrionalis TaxID=2498109 RepID=UPI000F8CECE3|nr:hypothetical protein [Legionella septentrionalis]RUR10499.1 hypothetical protein ELY14_05180 [Legionella septentrionalis]